MLKWMRSLFRRRLAPQPGVPGYEWYEAVQADLRRLVGEAGACPIDLQARVSITINDRGRDTPADRDGHRAPSAPSHLETLQAWTDPELLRGKSCQELFQAYAAEHALAEHEWFALLATASGLVSQRETA